MTSNFPGTAIVTGGSGGIGAAVTQGLLDKGLDVVVWDLDFSKSEISGKAIRIECDVTNEKSVKDAIEQTREKSKDVRYLVNCAGILTASRILGKHGPASLRDFEKTLSVNLTGSFNTMRLVAEVISETNPVNKDGERGAIINLSSIAAFEGQIGQAAYAASKGGLAAMTLPAARELASFGIRVVCIAPGIVETSMMKDVPDHYREKLENETPFPKRYVQPEEISSVVIHIIENTAINGEIIRVDGGLRLPVK